MYKKICLILISTTMVLSGCGRAPERSGVETGILAVKPQPPVKQEVSLPEKDNSMDEPEENQDADQERIDETEEEMDPEDTEMEEEWETLESTEADYQIVTETYEQGEIRIRYPQITGYGDEKSRKRSTG